MMNEIIVDNDGAVVSQRSMTAEQRQKELAAIQRQAEQEEKQALNSPFKRFVQLNKDTTVILRQAANECPVALDLFLFLMSNMDKYNAVTCSYRVLQEQLGKSQATIARAIKYLKENHMIYVYKSGSTNVYVNSPEIVWNSWGTNLKYCKFPANVLLSKSENKNQMEMQQQWLNVIESKQQNK